MRVDDARSRRLSGEEASVSTAASTAGDPEEPITAPVDDLASSGDPPPAAVLPAAVLPAAVLQRVVSLAAETLGSLAADDVPKALRRVARFTPARRAKLAGRAIAAALDSDVVFRQRVGELATERLAVAVDLIRVRAEDTVDVLDAADLVDVATIAYLVRPPGWSALLARASAALRDRASDRTDDDRRDQMGRLREQLEAVRASSREQLTATRAEVDAVRAENTKLRQRLGAAREAARAAETQARQAVADAAEAGAAAATVTSAAEADGRRLRRRLDDVEAALETARRGAREDRTTESIRARLLLDTLLEAAQGLRRELALPPVVTRPADLVGVAPGMTGVADVGTRGRTVDDPDLLDNLLALPQVHLVVDGYNVTKTGYGDLTLETQRTRLLGGLGALAARTSAEVTVVFDGKDLGAPVRLGTPRGVRVRFSPGGVSADDVIRDLVRAEPEGRPLVVVSSDREVADGVRRTGARPVASAALLRLLDGR